MRCGGVILRIHVTDRNNFLECQIIITKNHTESQAGSKGNNNIDGIIIYSQTTMSSVS